MSKSPFQNLSDKNIHILGVTGLEGSSVALYCLKLGCKNLSFHDTCTKENFTKNIHKSNVAFPKEEIQSRSQKLKNCNAKLFLAKDYLTNIAEADLIFAPQSWDMHEKNQVLHQYKGRLYNIIELYQDFFPGQIIAITGSSGKSSVTHYLQKSLQKINPNQILLAGNDRKTQPILSKENLSSNDVLILEVSNRQLKYMKYFKPKIAAITNISSNHISEHGSFENYKRAKLKITQNQTSSDVFILPKALNDTTSKARTIQYNTLSPIQTNFPKKSCFEQANYSLVFTILKELNYSEEAILESLQNLTPLPDRFEFLYKVNNINFYNDRQGTSVDSTLQVLNHLKNEDTFLIFGGATKDADLKPLIEIFQNPNVHPIGIQSPITQELSETKLVDIVPSLTIAVEKAIIKASKNKRQSNVLFSPACEYGPYFAKKETNQDYESYKTLVEEYKQNQ